MTSEIRANTIKNRVGLGTIEYSNTGPVISGVTTALNFKTGTSNLHSTGLNIFDLDVDGHTNLDNVSIAGVATVTGSSTSTLVIKSTVNNGTPKLLLQDAFSLDNYIKVENADNLVIAADDGNIGTDSYIKFKTDNVERVRIAPDGKLHVGGFIAKSTGGFASVISTGGLSNNGGFQAHYNSGAYGGGSMTTVNAAGGGLDFWTYTGNIGSEAYSRRLRIDSSGRILTGGETATEVTTGGVHIKTANNAGNTTALILENHGSSTNTEVIMKFVPSTSTPNDRWNSINVVNVDGNNKFDTAFYTCPGGPPQERLRINSDGDIGVNVSSPKVTKGIQISKGGGSGGVPNTYSAANEYLHLGAAEYNSSGGLFAIGFGYIGNGVNSPAYIGFKETNTSTQTIGDLVFATRSGTSDAAPAERVRVKSTGAIDIQSGSYITGSIAINTSTAQLTNGVQISKTGGSSGAPNTYSVANEYLHLGAGEYNSSGGGSGLFSIGFGYIDGSNNAPAYLGFKEESSSSRTRGSLVFATRNDTNDTEPTERLRIGSAGQLGVGSTAYYGQAGDCLVSQGTSVGVAYTAIPNIFDTSGQSISNYGKMRIKFKTVAVSGTGNVHLGLCRGGVPGNCPAGEIGIPIGFIPGCEYNASFTVGDISVTPWPAGSNRYEYYVNISAFSVAGSLGIFYLGQD